MKRLAAITALLSIAVLVLFAPTPNAALINQSGARHHVPAAAGAQEWADVYITNVANIGPQLATDGQTVGIEVGSDTGLLSVQVTEGSGASITIVENGSFDGQENAIRMVPPSSGTSDQYSTWLRELDIWDDANNNIAQMNFRVLVYYGPRYFDLSPNAKSWGFQIQTVLDSTPGAGDGNNRVAVFDLRDTQHSNWRFPYATVTTVPVFCNPLQGTFIEECPDANKLIEIRGGSPNHSASPPQTGDEWICMEHVADNRQNRGNANGLVRLFVTTRDGVVSDRYVEAPLSHDGGWDFSAQYFYLFEGLGFYFNQVGTADADNYVLYSHATFAANMANTDTLIGCDNIPGFLQNFFLPLLVLGRRKRRKMLGAWKRLLVALSLFGFAFTATADVTVLGTPTSNAGNGTSVSTAHTVGSGTDVVSYIAIFASNSASISTISFAGGTPTLVGASGELHLYRSVSPSAGATTASATLSTTGLWAIHVHTVQGVDTADPDDAIVTDTNAEQAELTATVTSQAGDQVIALGIMVTDNISASSGATLSTEEDAIDSAFVSSALVYEAGAASVVLGVSAAETFGDNFILAANVNAAAGGGASAVPKIIQQLEH